MDRASVPDRAELSEEIKKLLRGNVVAISVSIILRVRSTLAFGRHELKIFIPQVLYEQSSASKRQVSGSSRQVEGIRIGKRVCIVASDTI